LKVASHVPNLLLLVNEEAHVRELSRVADLVLRTGELRPVAFLEDRMKHLGKPAIFVEYGIEVLTSDDFTGAVDSPPSIAHRYSWRHMVAQLLATICGNEIMMKLVRRLAVSLPGRVGRFATGLLSGDFVQLVNRNRRLMLRRATVCDALFRQRPYVALVMSEDNVELDTAVWIAVARRHGVRSVIVPFTISNTAEFAESYVNWEPYQVEANEKNRLAAALFPAWTLRYKKRRFVRAEPPKIVAVESLGLTPPNPWLLNSGYADTIAVESAAMYDYYRAAGIPSAQLVSTGSLADDVIAAALTTIPQRRRALLQEFGCDDDTPLLLCGLPPDQKTYDRPGCEFTSFDDMLAFWGDCLKSVTGWNVIIRPHPKTPPDRLGPLRERGLNISYADTAALVPLCDLYVAATSATIRWAIACGKPVINYDVYQYGYRDYEGVQGVLLVNTRADFSERLSRLTANEGERAALAAAQEAIASRWGRLDGFSGKRLLALLHNDLSA
jgi:hypothetical protein